MKFKERKALNALDDINNFLVWLGAEHPEIWEEYKRKYRR
jgi:hypothetical protein